MAQVEFTVLKKIMVDTWSYKEAFPLIEKLKALCDQSRLMFFSVFGSVLTIKGKRGTASDLDILILVDKSKDMFWAETGIKAFFKTEKMRYKVLDRKIDGRNILTRFLHNNKIIHFYIKELEL